MAEHMANSDELPSHQEWEEDQQKSVSESKGVLTHQKQDQAVEACNDKKSPTAGSDHAIMMCDSGNNELKTFAYAQYCLITKAGDGGCVVCWDIPASIQIQDIWAALQQAVAGSDAWWFFKGKAYQNSGRCSSCHNDDMHISCFLRHAKGKNRLAYTY